MRLSCFEPEHSATCCRLDNDHSAICGGQCCEPFKQKLGTSIITQSLTSGRERVPWKQIERDKAHFAITEVSSTPASQHSARWGSTLNPYQPSGRPESRASTVWLPVLHAETSICSKQRQTCGSTATTPRQGHADHPCALQHGDVVDGRYSSNIWSG